MKTEEKPNGKGMQSRVLCVTVAQTGEKPTLAERLLQHADAGLVRSFYLKADATDATSPRSRAALPFFVPLRYNKVRRFLAYCRWGRFLYPGPYREFIKELRSLELDVVYSDAVRENCLVAAYLARKLGIAWIAVLPPETVPETFSILQQATFILCDGATQRSVVTRTGVPPERVTLLPLRDELREAGNELSVLILCRPWERCENIEEGVSEGADWSALYWQRAHASPDETQKPPANGATTQAMYFTI